MPSAESIDSPFPSHTPWLCYKIDVLNAVLIYFLSLYSAFRVVYLYAVSSFICNKHTNLRGEKSSVNTKTIPAYLKQMKSQLARNISAGEITKEMCVLLSALKLWLRQGN